MLIEIARRLPRQFNLNRTRRFIETKTGLRFTEFDVLVPKHRNVFGVLSTPAGKLLIPSSNIVTDAGDIHNAQKIAGEAPTNAFTTGELASAGTPAKGANRSAFTVIAATQKTNTATYPKTNDGDADNTGAGVDIVTRLFSYAKADFNHAAITHGLVTNVTPGANEPLLTGFAFATAFEKSADDSLKVFVNHEFTGV